MPCLSSDLRLSRPLAAFFFALALFLSSLGAWAAPSPAIQASDGALLNDHADLLIDDSNQMTIAQVQQSPAFRPLAGATGLGLIDHPVWLRLVLRHDAVGTNQPDDWWLDLSPDSMADVQFFAQAPDGQMHAVHAGDDQPFSSRPLAWRQYLFPVHLAANQDTPVYIRLRGFNTLVVPLRLWRLQTWAPRALSDYLLIGGSLGVMVGLALYNLLLALRLRQRIFLLYFLLITSYVLFSADLIGLASQYLWPTALQALNGRNQALVALYGAFGALFPLHLLDTPKVTRWYRPALYGVAGIYALAVVLALVGATEFAGMVIQRLPVVWFPLVMGVAVYRAVTGFRPAWYYLIGYGPVFVTLTMLIMLGHNQLPATPFTMNAFLVAGAFEAILFSQALAERFNILRREREAALELAVGEKQERLKAAELYQGQLERKVMERTLALEQSQEALRRLAYHDSLTELPNRLLFRDRMEQLIASCKRKPSTFTLVVIDLDGFKSVNDGHGHQAGDYLLKVVAERLRKSMREIDTVSRLGGDEFAILIPALSKEQVASSPIFARIAAACAQPVEYEGERFQVRGSLGLACFGEDGQDRETIYRAADQAMYSDKAAAKRA